MASSDVVVNTNASSNDASSNDASSGGGSGDGSTMRLHGVLPRIDITVYSSIDAEDQTASTFLTYMNHLSFDVTNNSAATTGTTAAGATATAAATTTTTITENTKATIHVNAFGCSVPPVKHLNDARDVDNVLIIQGLHTLVVLSTEDDHSLTTTSSTTNSRSTTVTDIRICPEGSEQRISISVGVTIPALVALTEIMPTVTALNEEAISFLSVRSELPEEARFVTNAATDYYDEEAGEGTPTALTTNVTDVAPSKVRLQASQIDVSCTLCHTLPFYSENTDSSSVSSVSSPSALPFVGLNVLGVGVQVEIATTPPLPQQQQTSSLPTPTTTTAATVTVQQVLGLLHTATPTCRQQHALITLTDPTMGALTLNYKDNGEDVNGDPTTLQVMLGTLHCDLDLNQLAMTLGIYATNIQPEIDQAIVSITTTAQRAQAMQLAGSTEEVEATTTATATSKKQEDEEPKEEDTKEEETKKEETKKEGKKGLDVDVHCQGIRVAIVASHSADALTLHMKHFDMKVKDIGKVVEEQEGEKKEEGGGGSVLPPLEFTLQDIALMGTSEVPLIYRSDMYFMENKEEEEEKEEGKEKDKQEKDEDTVNEKENKKEKEYTSPSVPFVKLVLCTKTTSPGSRYAHVNSINCEVQPIIGKKYIDLIIDLSIFSSSFHHLFIIFSSSF